MPLLSSTTYTLSGIHSHEDVLAVRLAVSNVADVGAVAIERESDDAAKMIIKHKADVQLDRAAVAGAVKGAGNYGLA